MDKPTPTVTQPEAERLTPSVEEVLEAAFRNRDMKDYNNYYTDSSPIGFHLPERTESGYAPKAGPAQDVHHARETLAKIALAKKAGQMNPEELETHEAARQQAVFTISKAYHDHFTHPRPAALEKAANVAKQEAELIESTVDRLMGAGIAR